MRSAKQKIYITLVLFGILFFLFVSFLVLPFFKKLEKTSQELALQKTTLSLFENQLKELRDFQGKYPSYQPFLAEIEELFVSQDAPIEFIEFLEKEARASELSLEIAPLNLRTTKNDLWPPVAFSLSLAGRFPNCLRFLERLEESSWLIEITQLTFGEISEKSSWLEKFENVQPGDIYLNLTLKVFSPESPLSKKE